MQAEPEDFFNLDKFEKVSDDILSLDDIPGITPNTDYWPEQPDATRVLYNDIFHFHPHIKINGQPGSGLLAHCHLRLLQSNDKSRAVSLVTELGSNPGQSVTNAAETIATLIIEQFSKDGLTPENTTFFERYTSASYKGRGREENFDLIKFSWHANNIAYEVDWKSSTNEAYAQAIKALGDSSNGKA